jgi:hypothetical protein
MAIIETSSFTDPGLYLLFPNDEHVSLTREDIESRTRAFLDDPEALPPHVRAATDYQPCDICPERDTAEICHAIMTTLPFFDDIDRYMSHDNVTAVFRDAETDCITICETTMQDALQFVTILSLMYYCEVGRKYYTYFEGVNPLMPVPQIAKAVFSNVYRVCRGNIGLLEETLETMTEEVLHIATCQAKRLRLISAHDAFLNAFVNTELIPRYVQIELRKCIKDFGAADESR